MKYMDDPIEDDPIEEARPEKYYIILPTREPHGLPQIVAMADGFTAARNAAARYGEKGHAEVILASRHSVLRTKFTQHWDHE